MTASSSTMAASALQSLVYMPAGSEGSSSNGGNGGNGGSGLLPTLAVLDQLLIPREKAYIDVKTVQDAWQVGCCMVRSIGGERVWGETRTRMPAAG
jgi:hypothetical protein